MNASEYGAPQGADPQHGSVVTITVDNKPYGIHRGHQTLAALKDVAGVPAAYQLDGLIGGTLTPLNDDGAVTVKGGEESTSSPKGGPFS